jgi:hypothetical protein
MVNINEEDVSDPNNPLEYQHVIHGSDEEDGDEQEGEVDSALLGPHNRTRGSERSFRNPLKLWPQIRGIVIEVSLSRYLHISTHHRPDGTHTSFNYHKPSIYR